MRGAGCDARRRARRASRPWFRRPAVRPTLSSARRTRGAAAEWPATTGSRRHARPPASRPGSASRAVTSSGCRRFEVEIRPTATSRPRRIRAEVRRTSNMASDCRCSDLRACAPARRARRSARPAGTPQGRARAPGPRRGRPAPRRSASTARLDSRPASCPSRYKRPEPRRGSPASPTCRSSVSAASSDWSSGDGRRPRRHARGPMSVSITSPASAVTSFRPVFRNCCLAARRQCKRRADTEPPVPSLGSAGSPVPGSQACRLNGGLG